MASLSLNTSNSTATTVREMSVAAKHHLDRASLKFSDDPQLEERQKAFDTAASAATDPKQLRSFTVFTKLPVELQYNIWKIYASMYPRGVDLAMSEVHSPGTYRNMGLTLTNINKQIRNEAYTVHGYVRLQHPTIPSQSYLLNPAMDLLMLSRNVLRRNGFRNPASIIDCLTSSDVLHKLRSIVFESSQSAHQTWMPDFAKLKGLEVLFIVIGERHVRGQTELHDPVTRPVRWKLHAVEQTTPLPSAYGGGVGETAVLMAYKQELMELLATNQERKVPEVVFFHHVHIHEEFGDKNTWW
ncbi:uncharacterized protein RSE6_04576 [Rhynchosporium secalis]|uniref:2EXR domain-containing protein n=1 Tax=Rhynchosporium secalis TaxID=38038 RepID=A0A1E1M5N1_RHYSE|nr:uncharacterized protein RSE6_04576 [Rhynchosporium secalis]